MLRKIAMLSFTVLTPLAPAVAAEWTIDKTHSSVQFKVRHMVVSRTSGTFNDFAGSIIFDGDFSTGSTELTLQAASLYTANEDRDNHVTSEEFLDVKKYPTIKFISKKIVTGKEGKFKLTGDLTIKDVTKEVTFDCEYFGETLDPRGNTRMGFSAEARINRQDFNVKFDGVLESGGLVVGNEVSIFLEIEAIKQKPEEKSKTD